MKRWENVPQKHTSVALGVRNLDRLQVDTFCFLPLTINEFGFQNSHSAASSRSVCVPEDGNQVLAESWRTPPKIDGHIEDLPIRHSHPFRLHFRLELVMQSAASTNLRTQSNRWDFLSQAMFRRSCSKMS